MALLSLASSWAKAAKRPLLALTVDHGLHPDSARWSDFARRAAEGAGTEWRGLAWTGEKPATGLPAAARAARHALLAGAARAAGARVILMAHTADDVAEGDWMRERGSTLGRPRDWAPSPTWPEGRGLMLLRPLLDVSRASLRDLLREDGLAWIEDPANADPRFLRSRARRAIGGGTGRRPPLQASAAADLLCDAESGVVTARLDSPWLGHALACASGRARLPASVAVERLRRRLAAQAARAGLGGALVSREGDRLTVTREPGRHPLPDLPLPVGHAVVWDGRFEALATEPGWIIGAAAGRRSRLSREDRARLNRFPAAARPAHPVLFRDDGIRPVLACREVEVRCLVPGRLRLATGGVLKEADLDEPAWRAPDPSPI